VLQCLIFFIAPSWQPKKRVSGKDQGDNKRGELKKFTQTTICRHMSQKTEVVVITRASADVGRATAREFARRGAAIGLIARGVDGLKAAQKEVEEQSRDFVTRYDAS
jgi:hypothetical protein